jgi:hypothetical protein
MRRDYSFLRPSKSAPAIEALLSIGIQPTPDFMLISFSCFGYPADYDYIVVHGGLPRNSKPIPEQLYRFIQFAVEAAVPVVGLCTEQSQAVNRDSEVGLHCPDRRVDSVASIAHAIKRELDVTPAMLRKMRTAFGVH